MKPTFHCVFVFLSWEPYGADGDSTAGFAKTVTRSEAEGCPGAVGSATLPLKRLRRIQFYRGGEGWVSPFGDSFYWRGRLGRGFPKGETKAGEERRGLCLSGSGAWAGGGSQSIAGGLRGGAEKTRCFFARLCSGASRRPEALPYRRSYLLLIPCLFLLDDIEHVPP
jgi:hypothetical protein